MAFIIELSSEQRRQIEANRQELRRLYRLPPRWLARYLVKTARELRSQCRWGPAAPVYDATLLWHLVPELAYRLGETRFTADERRDRPTITMGDMALSQHIISCLRQISWSGYHVVPTSRVFLNATPEGNPILYGLAHLVGPSHRQSMTVD